MEPEQYTTGEATSEYLTPAPDSYSDILFSFEGRINRAKYWGYAVVVWIGMGIILWTSYFIAVLLVIWPSIALGVKRCHDRNRSGWFMILSLIPILNFWYLIEIGFLRGTEGPNDYGEDPLA